MKTLSVLSSLGVSTSSWGFRAFHIQSSFSCECLGLVAPPTSTQIPRRKGERISGALSLLKSLLLLLTRLRWERWRLFQKPTDTCVFLILFRTVTVTKPSVEWAHLSSLLRSVAEHGNDPVILQPAPSRLPLEGARNRTKQNKNQLSELQGG